MKTSIAHSGYVVYTYSINIIILAKGYRCGIDSNNYLLLNTKHGFQLKIGQSTVLYIR